MVNELKVSEAYTGAKSGRLTLIREVERNKFGKRQWLCRCICGNYKVVTVNHLGYDTFSCGCILIKHGDSKPSDKYHRLYQCYADINQRITNEKNKFFKDYGGRGIKNLFKNYQEFKEWSLSHGYNDNLTIDRIDVNFNYEPSNCRWVTPFAQANNRRNNLKMMTPVGELSLGVIAKKYHIPIDIVNNRYRAGDSFEDVIRPHIRGKHNNKKEG